MKIRSRNHMIISSPQHDNRHRADCDLFECIDEIRSPREVARLPHSMGVAKRVERELVESKLWDSASVYRLGSLDHRRHTPVPPRTFANRALLTTSTRPHATTNRVHQNQARDSRGEVPRHCCRYTATERMPDDGHRTGNSGRVQKPRHPRRITFEVAIGSV